MRRSLLGLDRKPSEELRRLKSKPVPNGGVDAGSAADMSLDDEGVLERSRVVSSAQARMPYIGMSGKYNKRWYVDVVTLPHNSVRMLLSKLFSMVTAVNRLALDMTKEDFEKLFAYLSQLYRYVSTLLEAEEKILYPNVESGLRHTEGFSEEHALHPVVRKANKKGILALLSHLVGNNDGNTDNVLAKITATTKGNIELATYVQQEVDKFTENLMTYFSVKEKILPRLVATSIRGMRERNRMERLLIKFFADLGEEFHYAAMLAIPLQMKEVRDDFINRHFKNAKRKELFHTAAQDVEESLFGVAKAFDQASKKYESRFSMQEFLSHYGHYEIEDSEDITAVQFDDEQLDQNSAV